MILYTFRTFPYIASLPPQCGQVFVFAQLKKDMETFKMLLKTNPDQVIGIALTQGATRQEPVAINRFNAGKVIAGGPDSLHLTLLPAIRVAPTPTHTFCNWTMYTIQNYITDNKLSTAFSFIHLNPQDLDLLQSL